VWKHWVEPEGFDLQVTEQEGHGDLKGSFLGDLEFRTAYTDHSQLNLAWRIGKPGESGVLFTGDGEPTREIVDLGRSAPHILVSECSAGPDKIIPGHLNPEQAGELAARCGSRLLILSHINPGPEPETLLASARKHFNGEVVVAEDGMEIEIL
jgi:ribonuclease BN (tRNA processing enzyme)